MSGWWRSEGTCGRALAGAEGGARLAVAVRKQNTFVALPSHYSAFLTTHLLFESACVIRGPLSDGYKRSVVVTQSPRIECLSFELSILTDLYICHAKEYDDFLEWTAELEKKQVIVSTSEVLCKLIVEQILPMPAINLMIVDCCHTIDEDGSLQKIMQLHKDLLENEKPRILALTYPLFSHENRRTKDAANVCEATQNSCEVTVKQTEGSKNDTDNNESVADNDSKFNVDLVDCDKDILINDNYVINLRQTCIDNNARIKIVELPSSDDEKQINDNNTNDILINNTLKCDEIMEMDTKCNTDNKNNLPANLSIVKIISKNDKDNITPENYKIIDVNNDDNLISDNKIESDNYEQTEKNEIDNNLNSDQIVFETDDSMLTFNEFTKGNELTNEISEDESKNELENERELVFNADMDMYSKFEWKLDLFEEKLNCNVDLAEDIEGFKRISWSQCKPKETIIEYMKKVSETNMPANYLDLDKYMRCVVANALEFFHEHRYDPTEIYGDDNFCEELKGIPNPTVEPRNILKLLLYALDELGPYGADKAAFNLLVKLEKLKVKIPYERHFLLLCVCTTVLIKLRSAADIIFQKYENDLKIIEIFSKPKLLRFFDVLRQFRPVEDSNTDIKVDVKDKKDCTIDNTDKQTSIDNEDLISSMDNALVKKMKDDISTTDNIENLDGSIDKPFFERNKTHNADSFDRRKKSISKMADDLEKCDFKKLGDKLEDKVNFLKMNLKEFPEDLKMAVERRPNKRNIGKDRKNPRQTFTRKTNVSDSLCGLVLVREPIMAEILFAIVVEATRCDPRLDFVRVQYSAGEFPDPTKEIKDYEHSRKKQEEVLKKFRMHDCNLLIATNCLEEGIELPRCNLVLRWDEAASYYWSCWSRARARAARSAVCSFVENSRAITTQAVYMHMDKVVNKKCGCGAKDEPPLYEEEEADFYSQLIEPYCPLKDIQNNEISPGTDSDDDFNKDIRPKLDEISISDDKTVELEQYETINKFDKNSKNEVDTREKRVEQANDSDEFGLKIDGNAVIKDALSEFSSKNNEITVKHFTEVDMSITKSQKHLIRDRISDKNGIKTELQYEIKTETPEDLKMNDDQGVKNETKSEEASVDLNNAISLINRYCGKLPSDTFTRLAPMCWTDAIPLATSCGTEIKTAYICTIRLPVNCPVKYNVVGHPMTTRALARRMAALQACRVLHKSGELDQHLMPIGKDNYSGCVNAPEVSQSTQDLETEDLARPGTTKRRQYYYKRTAWSFTDCEPIIDGEVNDSSPMNCGKGVKIEREVKENLLYALDCELWCPLPERYNTRGRKIHAPQSSRQALGLLTSRVIRQIPSFPVYTRSGEVRVRVTRVNDADVRLTKRRADVIKRFMHFVFADVLRIRRRGMRMSSDINQNNYYIVPTKKLTNENSASNIDIDWSFLDLIYEYTESKLHQLEKRTIDLKDMKDTESEKGEDAKESVRKLENPYLKPGEVFHFDPELYSEAVVTPWYRNQDQPQALECYVTGGHGQRIFTAEEYFLVAEICWQLTADSPFPSPSHRTFRHYYGDKYGVEITQPKQPLLDVDHTSGRLNLLTPRYVNRKGVALPVSSERTRRARRERLDQKQLLVPELSATHPFAAPLWAAAVALPAMLYRINALLIADEIRRSVAIEIGLGVPDVSEETAPGFEWAPLDFGWSLADVLKDGDRREKAKDKEKIDEIAEEEEDMVDEIEGDNDMADDEKDVDEGTEGFEIGTWSNEMAGDLAEHPELTFCNAEEDGIDWREKFKKGGHPHNTFSVADSDCSYMSSDFDSDDTDMESDTDTDDTSGFCSSKAANAAVGVRIEYRTAHEAEAVEVRPLKAPGGPTVDSDWEMQDRLKAAKALRDGTPPKEHIENFEQSVFLHRQEIIDKNLFIPREKPIDNLLPISSVGNKIEIIEKPISRVNLENLHMKLFPFSDLGDLEINEHGQISIDSIENSKRKLIDKIKNNIDSESIDKMPCFSMKDINIDSIDYVDDKKRNLGFDCVDDYADKVTSGRNSVKLEETLKRKPFEFDYQPDLDGNPGPNPSVLLQALTMSNANDGINLERLETVGDSFLKFAITAHLYCARPGLHEGKLSHMRSKQVSNLNLYRLGKAKRLGEKIIASKFEPHDNWLPPGHAVPRTLAARTSGDSLDWELNEDRELPMDPVERCSQHCGEQACNDRCTCMESQDGTYLDHSSCFIPYNLITQHSIPDKSVADCVEALIGAYLVECGPRGALLFMAWLGIKVLPLHMVPIEEPKVSEGSILKPPGHLEPQKHPNGQWFQPVYGALKAPPSPLLRFVKDPDGELQRMLSGYDKLEETLKYRFKDRSLLLQALTHASHHTNTLTDCYQRLELLGDAVLDYIITRLLFEDERRHSPGALTDLRSALVNNTIFATLAVRHGFHKYFRHMSPGLHEVLAKYVRIQEENGHSISEEHYLIHEDEMEQAEDVEVPKALGDLFESIAGAIYLDSGMSLDAVWRSYGGLMASELELFSAAAPKSPVRELLEAEPDTAKFHKPERLADGRRVRVCVEVFGRGVFKGIGRNYRIAKGTAARCALRHLRGTR